MLKITSAELIHAADIADFQCKMAIETEHLTLDKEMVNQAAAYLVKHPQNGQYFVPIYDNQPEKACGSIAVTYENQKSWWIQSVYVKQQHRRKGLFTGLFKAVVDKGRQKEAHKVQLYVQKQNQKAKQTYKKLGMYCNGNQFFGVDLVYGNQQARKNLACELSPDIIVTKQQNKIDPKQPGYEAISGQFSEHNHTIKICKDNSVIGFCQYFTQFSDWRFGIIIYLSYLISKPQQQTPTLKSAIQYLYKQFPLKIGAVRIICKQTQIKTLQQAMPLLHRDVYDVMQIDL